MSNRETRFKLRFPPEEWENLQRASEALNVPKADFARAAIAAAVDAVDVQVGDIEPIDSNRGELS